MNESSVKQCSYSLTEDEIGLIVSLQIMLESYETCIKSSPTEEERENWRCKWTQCRLAFFNTTNGIYIKYIPDHILAGLAYPPVIEPMTKRLIVLVSKDLPEKEKQSLH